MAVTIARGAASVIRRQPGGFAVQAGDPSDTAGAVEALRRAAATIAELDGGPLPDLGLPCNTPKWVSDVVVVPDGPMLMIDGGYTPPRLLCTIPQIIAEELERAGVHGHVRAPKKAWDFQDVGRMPRAVALRVFAKPAHQPSARLDVPAQWRAEAARWIAATVNPACPVMCAVAGMTFFAASRDVEGLLEQWERERPGDVLVATGAMTDVVRAAALRLAPAGNVILSLTAGGRGANDDDRLAGIAELETIARRLAAQAAYAYISIEPTLAPCPAPEPRWRVDAEGAHVDLARELCDEIVLDAYPYQVLGDGHLERLGATPATATRLDDTHVEVRLGDASDWLFVPEPEREAQLITLYDPTRRDPDIERRARDALLPCLLSAHDALRLYAQRIAGT